MISLPTLTKEVCARLQGLHVLTEYDFLTHSDKVEKEGDSERNVLTEYDFLTHSDEFNFEIDKPSLGLNGI